MMTSDELINEIESLAYEVSVPIADLKYMIVFRQILRNYTII